MPASMIVIINPASGNGDDSFATTVRHALDKIGASYEARETTPEIGGDKLAAQAIREGAQHIVACGGDGTIMATINGLGLLKPDEPARQSLEKRDVAPTVTLSIIPGGTANLLATALSIPMDIEEAAHIATHGTDRIIDLGCCGDVLFALGLGMGLTEQLISQTSSEEKEKIGKLAYAKAMLREIGARPQSFSYRLDDQAPQRTRGVAIVVANTGTVGGKLYFAPDARMDDGLLDLCILHRFNFRDLLRLTWQSLRGRLPEDRVVSFFQARRIEIRSEPPLDLQIDGEEVDQQTPLVAEVLPRALKVRVPPEPKNQTLPGKTSD